MGKHFLNKIYESKRIEAIDIRFILITSHEITETIPKYLFINGRYKKAGKPATSISLVL